ncbi:unnamed protein product [Staurois parvus]|uniref:Uncharacterized protein n=1 Tax=Staurois parvus TaxID=386267 RepID=A0ABN9EPJ6_9NEOB|nr:unnamed protein product [Staurois parvus]
MSPLSSCHSAKRGLDSLNSQGWWEPLIMGTTGVQTQELSTGMVGTPHNGHSRRTDPGIQHRDGGNPS